MSTSRHLTGLRRFAKAAVAVCASLGLVLAAGGCGASSGESKTIYFWNNLVGDDGPAMQRIVKEYNAQSDYKVVFQPMNGGDLTTKIYSVMQTGKNIPDIIIGDQFQTAVLQSQGLLDTMDDWQKVAPDLKESSFLPATWKGVTVNGKAYGIPLYLYQMAIYYNKDLVKKYNLQYILDDGFVTIDEIKDLKGKLPKGTYALTYGNLPWAFMSLLYGAGGTLENDMDDLTPRTCGASPWRSSRKRTTPVWSPRWTSTASRRSVPARPCSRSLARGRRAICPTPWAPTRSRKPTPCSTAPTIR